MNIRKCLYDVYFSIETAQMNVFVLTNTLLYSSLLITHDFAFSFLATSTGPTVFPLIPCGSGTGDMVTLGCLATGFTPSSVTFKWTKGANALTDYIQYPAVQQGDKYTGVSQIQVPKADWKLESDFKCAVEHAAGNAQAKFGPIGKTNAKYVIYDFSSLT